MARIPKDTDYTVPVEGVGSFTFGRRKMVDEINIQREYANILAGVSATDWLGTVGTWIATFKVMMVRAPSDWDIDEMDPLDDATFEKMRRVYDALCDKELSFRRKPGSGSEGSGPPAV